MNIILLIICYLISFIFFSISIFIHKNTYEIEWNSYDICGPVYEKGYKIINKLVLRNWMIVLYIIIFLIPSVNFTIGLIMFINNITIVLKADDQYRFILNNKLTDWLKK